MLTLKKVCKTYGKKESEFYALNNIEMEIKQGELIAVVGPSGSGKSTLLNVLGCLDSPTSGQYCLNGEKINEKSARELAGIRNSVFGFVVQDFALINDYTVKQNVEIPLLYNKNRGNERSVDRVLEQLGILDKKKTLANKLSGGQRQRVAVARALVNNPQVILADEPTGSLDQKTGQEVMDILLKLHQNGKTVVIITHDKNIALQCERQILLVDGMIQS